MGSDLWDLPAWLAEPPKPPGDPPPEPMDDPEPDPMGDPDPESDPEEDPDEPEPISDRRVLSAGDALSGVAARLVRPAARRWCRSPGR